MSSNEGSEVEVSEQRRKSARILALEEEKREKQKRNLRAIANNTNNLSNKGKAILSGNIGPFRYEPLQHHGRVFSSKSTTMPPLTMKRGRNQKRLEDVDLSSLAQSLAQQDSECQTNGNTLTGNDQQPNGQSSIQRKPEKRIFECILDLLQRKDKYKIFAKPVDPKEVENYYTIIKEPMDFGTMRTKLHEGRYTSLEQFESDVFLISSNAIHFNSSTTIYYKEARRLQELAQTVFGVVRTDPNKLDSQFSLTRGGREPKILPTISEIKGPRTRLRRPTGLRASQLGSRDDWNSTSPRRGRPPISRPWAAFASDKESQVSAVYNAPKTVVESLLRFVKELGPTAQKVAARKLNQDLPKPPNPTPSQTPLIPPKQTITQPLLLPSPPISSPPRTASNNLLRNPINSANSPGISNAAYNQKITFLKFLLRNPPSPSSGIQINEPKTNNDIDLMFPFKQATYDLLGKMPVSVNVTGANRTYPSGQNINVAQQQQQMTNTQNSKFRLASHLKVIPVYDPNNGKRFRTVDMIAESNKRWKQLAIDQGDHDDQDHDQQFRNWQPMIRGKQKVVDHGDNNDEKLASTNWQSRAKDFVYRESNFLSPMIPAETTSFQTAYGSAQAGTSSISNYLMNSSTNSLANNLTHTNPSMEGFGKGVSSLQMMPSNDHDRNPFPYASPSTQLGFLPTPLCNETSSVVHDHGAGASTSGCGHQRINFTQELLPLMDSPPPDLDLQL
ncbi:hypothetical protein TIFTF001_000045 [Ficus carica]|uniref:Bromo domain-containing protein n=1 Tax=Ficus carica TaxID=3494 RepID=A0AA87ZEM6_FICCA|nr:hypothetical protein TIFTF001_000045 [Ficus carica]